MQVVDGAAVSSDAGEKLKQALNRARANAPAVLFIDNIDSVAPARKQGSSQVSNNQPSNFKLFAAVSVWWLQI